MHPKYDGQPYTPSQTVKQRIFQEHYRHLTNHGMVTCSCGTLLFQHGCDLCVATPPVENTIIVDESCSVCLERKRAAMFGTVHEVRVADLSYRWHEDEEQQVNLDYLTAQISVRELRVLLHQVEHSDLPPDHLLTVFLSRKEEDTVAEAIVMDGDPDGPPSANMHMGTCTSCKQHKLLCGPYCIACFITTYEDAHGPIAAANDLPSL